MHMFKMNEVEPLDKKFQSGSGFCHSKRLLIGIYQI